MKNILLSVNGVGVISKNNFLFTSFERTVYPWELKRVQYQICEYYVISKLFNILIHIVSL